MTTRAPASDPSSAELARRLAEANAVIAALLSGQIDAVVDPQRKTPVLLAAAQEALRESEERYRRIVETSYEGICTIDGGNTITFVNQRLADMLGYAPDELIGAPVSRLLPDGEEPSAAQRTRIERSRQGFSEVNEFGLSRKDGSELWALVRASPIRDAEGAYVGTLAMITDETSGRRVEEALRKSEAQYRQIVEATSDGIVKIDADDRIVFVNGRFAEMLGYTPQELIGMNGLAVVAVKERMTVAAAIEGRLHGARDVDTTCRHKDGSEISVNVIGATLVDDAGRYIGSLGIVRDVTEKNRLRSELMVSDRMASVGTLAAGVAHEINNPLSAVIANLEYMAESLRRMATADSFSERSPMSGAWVHDELAPPLDDAREAASRVRLIVRDLRIFSRSPSEALRGPVDVKATLESSLRMAWNEIRHRAQLVKHYGPIPHVQANEARLGQVFLNIIVNAAQALPEGHAEDNQICVTTRLEGERVVIEVRDTGAGIPPEAIGRVFDAFYTTKPVGVGTGLGLAICQRIVTDLGGTITVQSELGKGATFRVTLPVGCPEETNVAEAEVPLPAPGKHGRILVVDDEKILLRAVQRTLGKEHAVFATLAGTEALALIEKGEKFDLILCDLMMPDMTGMDLHRELSRIAPEQANRMLFMTGGAFTPSARAFLSDPPKEHMEKPFDPADLRAIVQRHLQTRAA